MKTYLTDFFEQFAYPAEGRAALLQGYDKIASNYELKTEFEELLHSYARDMRVDFNGLYEKMAEISSEAGIHRYTGDFLLLSCLSERLRQYYREAGVDGQIWHTSMCDLKWKLAECISVQGVWGTFVAAGWGWFEGFYRMERFGFRKLQFEITSFGYDYAKNGVTLTPESHVLNTHIPRTGERLDPESVRISYEQGASFFRERFGIDPIVFVCDSWLLYPRNREVLSPDSNLYSFLSAFDILKVREYDDYSEVWRLFDVNYDGNVDHLPQDTSFRRAYADWIRKGEKTGGAYGVYVWKG